MTGRVIRRRIEDRSLTAQLRLAWMEGTADIASRATAKVSSNGELARSDREALVPRREPVRLYRPSVGISERPSFPPPPLLLHLAAMLGWLACSTSDIDEHFMLDDLGMLVYSLDDTGLPFCIPFLKGGRGFVARRDRVTPFVHFPVCSFSNKASACD